MNVLRQIVLIPVLLIGVNKAQAQLDFDAIELIPGIVIPVMAEAEFYKPGWAINANYYYDDSYNYSLYGGLGFNQMHVKNFENGYLPFWAIGGYTGAQFKINIKEELLDFAVGGELGWMLRIYTGNPASSSFDIGLEQSIGVSPKLALHWRINKSWATLGFQCKYNAYFSLNSAFWGSSISQGIHQWLQPGISLKAYL